MAVPKRKVSKARRDKRRSAVWKLDAPALCKCSNCGELTSPHKVCKNCGYYKGGQAENIFVPAAALDHTFGAGGCWTVSL